ncbi:unnamed protein product [Closterium sp. NIES-54]
MAAHELRWLTYLLADLGEAPRSPPVLYVDNKAMLALCQEHRLEHRTKHIALRYFLARELQQRGQLRLAYMASQANTADVFTKALQPSPRGSLPPLPRPLAPSCLPCVEGLQRAAPHSSEFPPTTAPLQTLHMDVWGPARVSGTDQERYFLLVVDDYSRFTTVFPLHSKVDVTGVLIPWIRAARHQLRELFGRDLPVLRLHSDRGGEFSSGLLAEFCRDQGIRQTFTLPASPQRNGIADHHIGLVMEVSRTSMIHATAPHFWWPFAVRYAAHQLNLWLRGPAPLGVSQVDPPPLVEPLEISSDSSRPAEGGDPAADDTVATRRSPLLKTPPGGATRAGGAGAASPGGTAGAGGTGATDAGGAGGATGGARGTRAAGGAAGPRGALTGGAGAAGAGGAGGAGGGGGATGGARGTGASARGAGAAGASGAAGATGAGGAVGAGGARAGGTRGAACIAGAGGARAGGTGGTGTADGSSTAPRRPFLYPQPQSSLPLPDSALR